MFTESQSNNIERRENQSIEEFQVLVAKLEDDIKDGKYGDQRNKAIPSTLRTIVWSRFASDIYLKSKCFCCRMRDIEISNFDCGHIISRRDGGPVTLENLRPICGQCNSSMSTKNMCTFIEECGFWTQKHTSPSISSAAVPNTAIKSASNKPFPKTPESSILTSPKEIIIPVQRPTKQSDKSKIPVEVNKSKQPLLTTPVSRPSEVDNNITKSKHSIEVNKSKQPLLPTTAVCRPPEIGSKSKHSQTPVVSYVSNIDTSTNTLTSQEEDDEMDELLDQLEKFTVKQLKHLCWCFGDCATSKKDDLILRVMDNNITLDMIIDEVNKHTNEKYMNQCFGSGSENHFHVFYSLEEAKDSPYSRCGKDSQITSRLNAFYGIMMPVRIARRSEEKKASTPMPSSVSNKADSTIINSNSTIIDKSKSSSEKAKLNFTPVPVTRPVSVTKLVPVTRPVPVTTDSIKSKLSVDDIAQKFTMNQLKLICVISQTYVRSSINIKRGVIDKLIENNISFDKMNEIADEAKKYKFTVECSNWKYDREHSSCNCAITIRDVGCNKRHYHTYFTNEPPSYPDTEVEPSIPGKISRVRIPKREGPCLICDTECEAIIHYNDHNFH